MSAAYWSANGKACLPVSVRGDSHYLTFPFPNIVKDCIANLSIRHMLRGTRAIDCGALRVPQGTQKY